MPEQRWRGWENAEIYDRFVREHQIYRWLNRKLVELAELDGARRVLDLGCGTGATTDACLHAVPADAEVVGIDASPEMVALAESHVIDPRARFLVSDAAEVDRATEGGFDRAVSNAAFWQFPRTEAVLDALSRSLQPGSIFVFNVPAERIEGESTPFHPFQIALARQIEARTGEGFVRTSTPFEPETFKTLAADHGFEVERVAQEIYEGRQGEFADLMSIPAMIEPVTVGLSDTEVGEILESARAQTDPNEKVRVAWLYLRLRMNRSISEAVPSGSVA